MRAGGGTPQVIYEETGKAISSSSFDTGIPINKVQSYFLNTKNLAGYGCGGVVENGTITELLSNSDWINATIVNGNLGFALRFSSITTWTCDIKLYG